MHTSCYTQDYISVLLVNTISICISNNIRSKREKLRICLLLNNFIRKFYYLLLPTDLTLTPDRLKPLFKSVRNPERARFYASNDSIGDMLGLPQSAVKEIRSSFQSATERKDAYLDTYSHHHPCPSWRNVADVLRQCYLDQEAKEVEDTYVKGMPA